MNTRGQTVMMEDSNGNVRPVPAGDIAATTKFAADNGGWARVVKRSPGLLQRGVDALPDVGGTIGGFMGITPHMRAANATRLGIAGRATSHVINTITGAEESWTPQQAMRELGAEGVKQGAAGYSGEGIAKVGKILAPIAMKSSLGRAAVGSAKKALAYGLAPTEKFLARMNAGIGKAKDEAIRRATVMEAGGTTFTFDQLAKPVKSSLSRMQKHDITGTQAEDALNEVLGEMTSKLGPKTVTTPASTLVSASGAPLRGAFSETTPAELITPTQLQEINQIAGQKLKDLFAAKQGKLGIPPDPRELGIMKVWAQSKQMLEKVDPEIGKLNRQMQDMYKQHTLASRAGERAHTLSPIDVLAGSVAGAGAGYGEHSLGVGAAVGTGVALGRHLAMSPEALAAEARMLNSRGFGTAARLAPRAGLGAYRQLTAPGIPVRGPQPGEHRQPPPPRVPR